MSTTSTIYTTEKNGIPLNTTIALYLTPQEFSRGCDKIVSTKRIDKYGRNEDIDLSVQVLPGMKAGTVFTFDGLGNYIGDGVFQTVNVVLEEEPRSYLAHSQPIHAQTVQPQPFQQQMAQPQAFQAYAQGYSAQLENELKMFTTLKILKVFQSEITYFSNGDVGIKYKHALSSVKNGVPIKCSLRNGVHFSIPVEKIDSYGEPVFFRNVFQPVAGLSGNVWVLLIVVKENPGSICCACCV